MRTAAMCQPHLFPGRHQPQLEAAIAVNPGKGSSGSRCLRSLHAAAAATLCSCSAGATNTGGRSGTGSPGCAEIPGAGTAFVGAAAQPAPA